MSYEADFYAWIGQQAALLKAGDLAALDIPNLVEELESLARRERRELAHRWHTLLVLRHRWETDPDHRCRAWENELRTQYRELVAILEDSPSLVAQQPDIIEKAWKRIREDDPGELPEVCPWKVEEMLFTMFPPTLEEMLKGAKPEDFHGEND